jgi:hypothetical protein
MMLPRRELSGSRLLKRVPFRTTSCALLPKMRGADYRPHSPRLEYAQEYKVQMVTGSEPAARILKLYPGH